MGRPDALYLECLRDVQDAAVTVSADPHVLAMAAPEADSVLVTMGHVGLLRPLWPALGRLRWLHVMMAGLDTLWFPELQGSGVTLTNARGAYSVALAEYALGALLHFCKDVPRLHHQQAQRLWRPFPMRSLQGSTLGIVGYGDIGRQVALRARAFGMRTLGLRTAAAPPDDLVERVDGPEGLHRMLAESDHVVLCTPLTDATRHLLDSRALAAMKRGALLVNVGRGGCVDEAALLAALDRGTPAGVALDVFAHEPLAPDHPFWAHPRVLISPHNADITHTWLHRSMDIFMDNLGRAARGEPLRNVVDKSRGY